MVGDKTPKQRVFIRKNPTQAMLLDEKKDNIDNLLNAAVVYVVISFYYITTILRVVPSA